MQLIQKQCWADDNYFVTGFTGKNPAETKWKQTTPQAGAFVPVTLPSHPPIPFAPRLGGAGQELLGCKNENIKRIVPDKREYNRH